MKNSVKAQIIKWLLFNDILSEGKPFSENFALYWVYTDEKIDHMLRL